MPTLRVHRTGVPARYDIVSGDDPVTTVSARTAQHGGELDVGGQAYRLDGSAFGRTYSLRATDGRTVASAERNGRRGWRVVAAEREYALARTGFGSRTLELTEGDNQVGQIHRAARGAEADLPGLDRPVEVFVLILALSLWQRRRRAAVIGR